MCAIDGTTCSYAERCEPMNLCVADSWVNALTSCSAWLRAAVTLHRTSPLVIAFSSKMSAPAKLADYSCTYCSLGVALLLLNSDAV